MGIITEVHEIMDHCLKVLSYTEYLREDVNTREAFDIAERTMKSLRKLSVASAVQNKRVICISGLQGAGKTTLMRNFYGLDDTYLNSTRGRGERIPVFITEKKDITSPVAHAIKIEKGQDGRYIRREETIDAKDYEEASRGEASNTMFLELKVPCQHTFSEGISFMLLPGYEKKNDDWKTLIDFSVNSSDAAVFVFDSTSFSGADNDDYLRKIEERFGKNLIYVITHSDESPDDNAEVKETCMEVLGIKSSEKDRIVCVGDYRDDTKRKAWIEEFKVALEKYAYRETQYLQQNSRFMLEVIREIEDNLDKIQRIIEDDNNPELASYFNDKLLDYFDKESKKERKKIKKNLEDELRTAQEVSKKKLRKEFKKRPVTGNIRRIFFGTSIKDLEEASRITENALKDGNNRYLLDSHLVAALHTSCANVELANRTKGSINPLIISRDEESADFSGETIGELKALKEDVTNLLTESSQEKRFVIQSKDSKRLMRMIAEFVSYYYCYTSANKEEVINTFPEYKPSSGTINAASMLEHAEAAKKYAFGLLGIMGIDVVADGTIDFVSQIASAFGFPVPAMGLAATTVIGGGAISSVMRDISRMEFEDLASAEIAVSKVYENYTCEVMDRYDEYIEDIRERIEDRLSEHTAERRKAIIEYNTKVEIGNAFDLLRGISEKLAGEEYGVGATFS